MISLSQNLDSKIKIIGPFKQIVSMHGLPPSGPVNDDQLHIYKDAAICVQQGKIIKIAPFSSFDLRSSTFVEIPYNAVALPGFIDAHTHICYAGSRSRDYVMRLNGNSYQEIASKGGGILSTMAKTRAASVQELVNSTLKRLATLCSQGITTCEIKSGYGLDVGNELKMLEAINLTKSLQRVSIIPTCLAAHIVPPEFESTKSYLDHLKTYLLPLLKKQFNVNRLDIFVEDNAFPVNVAREYLLDAKKMHFSIVIHADQFSSGGARLAAEIHALSADHLEVVSKNDAQALKHAGVIPIVLPGASLGLGLPFAPARMLLDAGLPLVIASDWNPGSAPLGYLLLEAAVLGANQHLTMSETLAAITIRAAKALELSDRGEISIGKRADLAIFNCDNFEEILYNQGGLTPQQVFIHGLSVYNRAQL